MPALHQYAPTPKRYGPHRAAFCADDGLTGIVLTNRVGHDVNALATAVSDVFLTDK